MTEGRVLLLGSEGQVGSEIVKRAGAAKKLVAPELSELDITDRAAVLSYVEDSAATAIINCAAYTAVDKAEDESEISYAVNADGAGHVAEAAAKNSIPLVHVSTDYVFGRGFDAPITPSSSPEPLGVYGASKLKGEELCLERLPAELLTIVRTSSVHGALGPNFVHTMLRLFKDKDRLSIVSDQYMSPTWAGWLGELLLAATETKIEESIVHASCRGVTTWFDFTVEIQRLVSAQLVDNPCELLPIPASDYPVKAERPPYSVLDCKEIESYQELPPRPSWQDGLANHLRDLGEID